MKKIKRAVSSNIDNGLYLSLCDIRDRLNRESIQAGGKPILMTHVVEKAVRLFVINQNFPLLRG